jgi:iron complex transport system substrate-binding protein
VLLPFADSPKIWADLAGRTADAVGRTETVSALGKRFADRVARIRETRADVLGRVRIDIVQGGFDAGSYWLYGADSTFGGLLAAVGARFGAASAGVTGGNRAVSLEEISLLRDADVLFYYTQSDGAPANLGPALFAQAAFRALPATTGGRLFGTHHFLPASYTDAFGALDDIDAALSRLG